MIYLKTLSLSAQTHLINECTVLLHLTYSQGLLGVINHVVNSLKIKIIGTPYTAGLSLFILFCCNLCCFDAIYAVLMHYMLFYCNMCYFIAIHAVFVCHFIAIYAVLSRRHDCCKIRAFPGTLGVVPRHFQLLLMSGQTHGQTSTF